MDLVQKSPNPGLPHFDTPKNDNECLLNWQYAYLVEGDTDALSKMYNLGFTVSIKYIQIISRGNTNVAKLPMSEKKEKAHNAITYVITRYLKDADFFIKKSVTSYLYLRVKYELFYQRKVDGIVDFVDFDSFFYKKK